MQYLKFLMREQGKRILKPEKNAPGLTRATLTGSAKNNGSGKKKRFAQNVENNKIGTTASL